MKHIGTKLLLFISGAFLFFSSFLLYQTYQTASYYVHEIVEQQLDLALQFDQSIRRYVGEKIRPLMYELLSEDEFIPETMSTSFVARSIFTDVQKRFPDFILKFSSNDPRNPSNLAGPEELKIINYFNNNPNKHTWLGEININGELYFAKFNVRRMEESCLRCHGYPEDAPASLLERYGAKAGFFRPLGDVVALDTIAIPIGKIQTLLSNEIKNDFTVMGLALFLLVCSLFVAVKIIIGNRLHSITKHFSDAASSKDYSRLGRIKIKGSDEISVLAQSYNVLAEELQKYHNSLAKEKEHLAIKNKELDVKNIELQNALDEVKTLKGIVPICSFCKKIRDDKGFWEQVEVYVTRHSDADFSHGICPECREKHYPEIFK